MTPADLFHRAEPIKGQRLYTFGDPSNEEHRVIAQAASRCAMARTPFEAHGRRWIVTLIDDIDGNLVIEGIVHNDAG